ncbi:MAG: ion transporter [Cyclobacteriaceae bacterium]|nr:ion transporter [Cyclobacteriaceae bacterium]MCX7638038.1 ion transporter [Cyclobacteriaceae bacterium]MDW8332112.1 ion transporter [Cyclobacteriaceae bacterium]
MKPTFRKRLYLTLEPTERGGLAEQIFEYVLISIIVLNIVAIIVQSVPSVYKVYHTFFYAFELFSVIFFTLEYVARVYACVENPKYRHPVKGRLKYMRSGMAVIDLMAFLPFYLTFLPIDLRFLRVFRLMALFRMFKITRYMQAMIIFKKVLHERREQLVLSFVFVIFILIIISFFMYYAEHEAQPDKFGSIPEAMWWGMATLTTIGYGDVVPITPLGKFLGGIFALAGVAILALPTGILSSGFFELLHKPGSKKHVCPHCGKEFHDSE